MNESIKSTGMKNNHSGLEIAVIGMSVRFPSAKNINDFWENLKNGVESVAFFSAEELLEKGITEKLVNDPNYVNARVNLEGKEYFDSSFFGYTPAEAELMDPQTRIFHECVWESLEDAGVHPSNYKVLIGLYAGAGTSFFWEVYSMISGKGVFIDQFTARFLRDKDSLPTRISYKLNLNGPAIFIKTTCSTGLVAIHTACRGILLGDCKIALAGGVSLSNQSKGGYLYQEGMIDSRNGHCFAFDANASGTIWGEGAAVVVLKKLNHALDEGDSIRALIRGSAVNNDGERKVGYSAPSIDGQAEVIRIAQKIARVEPHSISYIETHGTGTALGDPVEIEALTQVFGRSEKKYCGLGSVKTNIGHLDTAAGVAGFIKTVLALMHRQIPPSLHFENPNPRINFESTPFYVNTVLRDWGNDSYPLRAGVSSFGIGGTNAHVILEEAPPASPSSASRAYQVLMFSAKTNAALDKIIENFRSFFENGHNINLADVAFTLHVGRVEFPHRCMLVCQDIQQAIEMFSTPLDKLKTFITKKAESAVVFMFPGQGSQYVDMGLELYRSESFFRNEIDRSVELLATHLGYDLRSVLYPGEKKVGLYSGDNENEEVELSQEIDQTEVAQPIIFIFEYALANLIMKWGIKPDYMIGYSYGEYVAACLAGVVSLEDAIKLVVLRGRLMAKLPEGTMLSVPLSREELLHLLNEELSLAIDNGPSCIVAGAIEPVERFEKQMREKGLLCMKVKMAHAGHSKMVEPILLEFEKIVKQIKLNRPKIPYISCISGDWIDAQEVVKPLYWINHLQSTVQFSKGLDVLLGKKELIFVEVGAGKALSNLVRQKIGSQTDRLVVNLLRNKEEKVSDIYYLLERLGRLWLYGQKIDWRQFYAEEKRNKIALPTHPFDKIEYPFGQDLDKLLSGVFTPISKKTDISEWFYVPSWKESLLLEGEEVKLSPCWSLFFVDDFGIGTTLLQKLEKNSGMNIVVSAGDEYQKSGDFFYTINPQSEADYMRLFSELASRNRIPGRVVHLWSLSDYTEFEVLSHDRVRKLQVSGFYSLLSIAKAIGYHMSKNKIDMYIITNNLFAVSNSDDIEPGKATILGAVGVIPQEYVNISCRSIDIRLPGKENVATDNLIDCLYKDICFAITDKYDTAAYRELSRWTRTLEQVKFPGDEGKFFSLRERGVYLITGGLGGMGLVFSEYLGKKYKARLILTGRSYFPARSMWQEWLDNHKTDDSVSRKILKLQEMEAAGAEILYFQVDITDRLAMADMKKEAEECFGSVNGIIHAAGVVDYGGVIHNRSIEKNEAVFASKIYGTLVLNDIFRNMKLDFIVLCSSISSFMPPFGEVGYAAGNAFLDAFAKFKNLKDRVLTISINWCFWYDTGMGRRVAQGNNPDGSIPVVRNGIHPGEGVEVFRRAVGRRFSQIAVSTVDFNIIIQSYKHFDERFKESNAAPVKEVETERPQLLTEYVKPSTAVECKLTELWQSFFGIKKIGINDDFFELGGDSLKAMNIVGRIYREFNIDIPFVELFNKPTIKTLAEYIEASEKEEFVAVTNVEKKEYYRLASPQRRLYIMQQMDPRNTSYNEFQKIHLGGEINRDRLEQSIRKLIERHESLRTSFLMIKEEPVQRIHDEIELTLEYFETCAAEDDSRRHNLDKIIGNFGRPFDLSKAPLWRVGLVNIDERKFILVIIIHHIIADGASQVLLEKDFLSLYQGQEEELPALKSCYRDFTEWQNSHYHQRLMKRNESYWVGLFGDEVPVLHLPFDYPRPIMQSYEGCTVSFVLSQEETKSLKRLTKELDVTLYMSLVAIFTALLAKLSGQEDIVVGTPIGARVHVDIEPIIGMFVNTVAMRNKLYEEMTFVEFLKGVKANTLEAFENQDYRFEDLVDRVSIRRDTGRNPIFDVMFNLMDSGERSLEISQSGETVGYVHRRSTSKFDLNLSAIDYERIIHFDLEYCTKLFKAVTIERIIEYFKSILNRITSDPAVKLGDIEIISEIERNQILLEFNNTQCDYACYKKIHELISEQVERIPDNTAVVGTGQAGWGMEQVSYKELEERTDRLASFLKGKGSGRGVIVSIMPERSLEMLIGILGILKSGGAYLPIDTDYPSVRIRFMLKDSGSELLLTQGNFLDIYKEICETVNLYNDGIYETRMDNLWDRNVSSDLAYVTYTSGSTGRPKGVMIRHLSVLNFIKGITDVIAFKERDVILSLTTICFDIFGLEMLLPLTKGARVVVGSREEQLNPRTLCDALLRSGISIFQITPSRLSLLIENKESAGALKELSYLLVGGEAFPKVLLEKVREIVGCKIYNLYGPTETTIWSTLKDVSGEEELDIGKPICNTGIYIVDRRGCLQPIGIEGELCIAGEGLAVGYLNRLELTVEKFMIQGKGIGERSRWGNESFYWDSGGNFLAGSPLVGKPDILYRTGDLARWQWDGNIEFAGRIDQQVKLRGFRVELGEIERLLTRHDKIKEALVMLKGDGRGGDYLCAYLAYKEDVQVTSSNAELREYMSRYLPDYMTPSYFVQVDEIPLTANGKINRRILPEPEIEATEEYIAPRNELEEKLVEIWADVLGINKDLIGVNTNFFELGGNSLRIININNLIKEHLNYDISIAAMFKFPTIRALVNYVREGDVKIKKSREIAGESLDIKAETIELLDKIHLR